MPPTANAEWVWALEDVRDVYTRPDDPPRPVGCRDEARQPLVAATRVPLPAAPGTLARSEDAYERQGTAQLCRVCEPWAGPRPVTVPDRRPAIDVAQVIRDVVEVDDPQADTIVRVRDHRHPLTPAALSAAFEPAEARRLWARLERPHTPQPGRW